MIDAISAMSILLVDDEIHLRRAIARSLTTRGYRVDEVGTCREAVAAASEGRYDLMLLDVNLPDATGWDALRQLSAAGRTMPTVIVSAVPPSASRIREFCPVGVLHKPFPIDALLRLVRSVADRSGADDGEPAAEEFEGGEQERRW